MENNLHILIEKIKKLERELSLEIQKQEEIFFYKIRKNKVYFAEDIKKKHKAMVNSLSMVMAMDTGRK